MLITSEAGMAKFWDLFGHKRPIGWCHGCRNRGGGGGGGGSRRGGGGKGGGGSKERRRGKGGGGGRLALGKCSKAAKVCLQPHNSGMYMNGRGSA